MRELAAEPIAVVLARYARATLARDIRAAFDRFYAAFRGKGGLNIIMYSDRAGGMHWDDRPEHRRTDIYYPLK